MDRCPRVGQARGDHGLRRQPGRGRRGASPRPVPRSRSLNCSFSRSRPRETTPSPRPTRAPSFFFLAAQRILLSCCPTNSRSLLSTCTPHLPCPPAPLTVHTRTRARAHPLLSFSSPPPFSLNISVKICRSGQTGPDEQTSPERRASCLTAR